MLIAGVLIKKKACICGTFENYEESRVIFLYISKAFGKVWHEGLLFKLKSNDTDGNLYELLKNFLSDRKQRVILNGCESKWVNLFAGVPYGSDLGPLLFLIYINDLTDSVTSSMRLFADHSSPFAIVKGVNITQQMLSNDLVSSITNWAYQ